MKSPNFDHVKSFCSLTELSVDIDTDNSVYITGLNINRLHIGWVNTPERAVMVLNSMRDLFINSDEAILQNTCVEIERFKVAGDETVLKLSVNVFEDCFILGEKYTGTNTPSMITEATQYFIDTFNDKFPQSRRAVIIAEINQLIAFINDSNNEPVVLSDSQLRLNILLASIKCLTKSNIEDVIRHNTQNDCKQALEKLTRIFDVYNNKR